jgi:transcriptional regulator with XRE-family HTH domain
MAKQQLTTMPDRIRHVVEEFFGGRQPALARTISVRQPTISRYCTGGLTPPRRVLDLIHQATGIPMDWLLAGEGPPPTRDDAVGTRPQTEMGPMLPVFREAPARTRLGYDHESCVMRRVLSELHRPSRYFLRAGSECRIPAVRLDDYLLMEGDRRWFRSVDRYLGRVCVVRDDDRLVLAIPQLAPVGRGGQQRLVAQFVSRSPMEPPTTQDKPDDQPLEATDIIAVCIRLERDYGGERERL